jgi:hypothetical protein
MLPAAPEHYHVYLLVRKVRNYWSVIYYIDTESISLLVASAFMGGLIRRADCYSENGSRNYRCPGNESISLMRFA